MLGVSTRSEAASHRQRFTTAQPFPHVVVDDFLEPAFAQALLDEFPAFERGNAIGDDGRPGGKSTVERIRALGASYARLDDLVRSRAFLEAMSALTGIPDLLYDPFYLGGGTHENRSGQSLDPHIDFNYHPSEGWHRRLNLIVYLNHEWDAAWGGALELFADPYAQSGPSAAILPLFNRGVIFETSERSWHAFPTIRTPERTPRLTRRSIALYFYTRERPAAETAGKHSTVYVDRQLPERYVAGRSLTAEDVDELKALLRGRDLHLKRLYAHQARLLQAMDRGLGGRLLYLARRAYVRMKK
jgi:hypothetical protein